jgi:hypothetical protein
MARFNTVEIEAAAIAVDKNSCGNATEAPFQLHNTHK